MKKPQHQRYKRNKKIAHVRIIGGEHKRRLIGFIETEGLRPSPDRLRETLFNWLMPYLSQAHVLDVCAGSGVLGFEAISRGAKLATLIEPNHAQFLQLQQTIQYLGCQKNIQLLNQTAQNGLPQLNIAYDVIFLDPPYALNLWLPLLQLLKVNRLCHPDSLIYIEANQPHQQLNLPSWLTEYKYTHIGQIYAALYQLNPSFSWVS